MAAHRRVGTGDRFVAGQAALADGGSWDAGSLVLRRHQDLIVGDGSTLLADDLVLRSGTLTVTATGMGTIGFGPGSAGVLTVTATVSGAGTITAANGIEDDGIITASHGRLTLNAAVFGTGAFEIGAGATLSLAQISTVTIFFTDPGGTLQVARIGTGPDAVLSAQGTIFGFQKGETIRYGGPEQVTSVTIGHDIPGLSTLNLFSDGILLGALTLAGEIDDAAIDIGTQGRRGTPITLLSPEITACYAEGTLIRTTRGEIPVEALQCGDLALSAFGGTVPIIWIGHRRVDCAAHPRPHDVWPVRVHAGAFRPGMPKRDLLLSPDHAVFTADVLVPIRYLLNGATIVQERTDAVTYHHVELRAHDVILAEALPCESYLDTGNRAAFANASGATMLHPDFARGVWEAEACAQLVTHGPQLNCIRAALLRQAASLGHVLTDTPRLSLLVDGHQVRHSVNRSRWTVTLPPGARELRLLSQAGVPGHSDPASTDMRALGVALCGLKLDGQTPDDRLTSGWHPHQEAEPADWRWTDGDAVLRVEGCRELRFDLVMAARVWRPIAPQMKRCA
jgi:hypothetical protein